jgi:polyhydroxyalkanoate synthase
MMRWLVAQGYTVFIISWVNPGPAQKLETWDSYMDKGLSTALDKVLEETNQKQAHLASYCIGGTLTGTALAHFGKTGDTRVASATFFTAQFDFEDAGELQVFVDDQTISLVDEQMEEGYLPAETMANAFNMLRSNDLIWSYIVSNYMLGKEPFPFDLLYWNADSTSMPARVHHFYLEQFYNDNALVRDCLPIKDSTVHLADVNVPVYHLAAVEDHIAPAASVYRGAKRMENSDMHFVLAGSGHIAGVVNPPAAEKYQHWINDDVSAPDLESWKAAATQVPGSWWTDWDRWLAGKSGRMVKARKPGAKLGQIEPAPGRYVKVRFDAPN